MVIFAGDCSELIGLGDEGVAIATHRGRLIDGGLGVGVAGSVVALASSRGRRGEGGLHEEVGRRG